MPAHFARRLKEPRSESNVIRKKCGSDEEGKMKAYKLRRSGLLTIFAAWAAFLSACSGSAGTGPVKPAASPSPIAVVSPTAVPAVSPVTGEKMAGPEKLVGHWNGPEGTYINITEKTTDTAARVLPRAFLVEINNLDKAETFEGIANGDVIEFKRGGKTESVKTATGVETGMKGFEKETDCVVVTKGSEGFCKKQ